MRGYQKKIIYMKNTGSELFEEAYFVVKSDTPHGIAAKERLVDEANRIINENFGKRKRFNKRLFFAYLTAFLIGAAVALILCFTMN